MINDDDALAEFLDVGHVVAGQNDGRLLFRVVAADEIADGFLRRDIESDGRLVEK